MSKFALCIGINEYVGAPLAGCANDAEDWAEVLDRRGFDTTMLLDDGATRANILACISTMISAAGYQDQIVICFSGHGTWLPDTSGDEPDRRDEALCPWDYRDGLIVDDDLHDAFAKRQHGVRIVFISDSCHSGSVTRLAAPLTDRGTVRFLPPELVLAEDDLPRALATPRTPAGRPRHAALLLSGCQDLEYSYDATFDDRPNGAFSYVALRTLADLPDDATYVDWHRAIRSALPSQDYPQTPMIFGTTAMKRWPAL